jgi:hypothetical protein
VYKLPKDSTPVKYWFKKPNGLLQHQIVHIITGGDLKELQHVDLTVGGDHGKGRFCMILKMILRYSNKESFSRLFQIASIEHSKDDIEILQNTVLKPIGEELRLIKDGGRFIVVGRQESMFLHFGAADHIGTVLCDVPIRMFMVGDLKFHAQMLGRNNMSTSWCMWCQLAPHEWKILQLERDAAARQRETLWTIDSLKAHKLRMIQGYIKVSKPKGSMWSSGLSHLGFY